MTKRSPTARPHADRIPRVPVGPLAPTVLGECRRWLGAQGYSPGSAAGIVNLLGRLSLWMREVCAGAGDINGELLDRFVAAERSRVFVCVTVKSSMSTMCRFLTDAGYLDVTSADTGPRHWSASSCDEVHGLLFGCFGEVCCMHDPGRGETGGSIDNDGRLEPATGLAMIVDDLRDVVRISVSEHVQVVSVSSAMCLQWPTTVRTPVLGPP